MSQSSTINIPESLYQELSKALDSSIFNAVDDLAAFILQQYLDTEKGSAELTLEEDEQAVKERLRNLGYL